MPADILHAEDSAGAIDATVPALEMHGIDKRFPGVLSPWKAST